MTFAGTVGADETNQYIVTTKARNTEARLESAGFTVEAVLADGDVLIVSGSKDPSGIRGVNEVIRDARFTLDGPVYQEGIEEIESDTEEETLYPLQWDKHVTNVAEAHETATGDGTTIAIIDTGIDLDHPDLQPNVVPGALFRRIAGRGDDVVDELDDGLFQGLTDVRVPKDPEFDEVEDFEGNIVGYDPGDFEIEEWDASDDVHAHGSHVAGIAAASVGEPVAGWGTGIAGTAPDATVIPHRVFFWELRKVTYEQEEDEEVTEELVVLSTTTADILAAIDFAGSKLGVDAMNMSIGTPPLPPWFNREGFRQAYRLVIQHAVNEGSVVVVSAGNSDTELNKGGVFTVPNSVPGAMSIGATGPNDKRTFYSNYGANELSLAAPGGGYETLEKTFAQDTEWPFPSNLVLSTTPLDIAGALYAYFAGTSMAAPQVVGAAALLAGMDENLNPHQIETILEQTAETATGTDRRELGAGRLDVKAAVEDVENE